MKPQAAGCLENECGPGTTSAAQPNNFDTPIDDWAKDNAWNVLATVKNKIIRKRVVLRKMRSYKRIDTPPLNDAFDASKVNEQKAGHCTRVDSASSERRAASSVCSYRLSTSSLDTGQDVEHCAWDREPASFASDCSFLQRSFAKQAAFRGCLISHTGESSALHRKDSSTCRAVEKHRLCERLDGENASVDVKLEFRSVAPKLANGSRRKEIPCKGTIRRKGRLLSKSPKMVDGLGDRFPAFSKDYRDRPSDPESSSKQWISSTSSNIIQRRDCNAVLLEDSTSSVFYSSRPLERTTTKISTLRNCYREENQDPLPVEATVSSVSLTNNERAAACRKAQCWKWSYSTEAQSRAQSRIVPAKVKKVRKVKESIAVVKRSYNPYQDFQSSMLEMIISKKIQEPAKLKELLECYIALNSPSYRELIMAAFENVCHHMLFSKASAQSTSPRSHFSACL
ncbi:hypothetical protein O6H91_01G094800 [Diphasiastrum complanatum]|uniref:Uncharacterized protein n=1 Tax=Diphasiastrum complanatum TaxID=34168 RepID=A0ACC2ETU3_DIPCM|nr:hypothetical protein O6H91_01G094800 [Diphasiastrum complanatum]